jgi:hypothetical protein
MERFIEASTTARVAFARARRVLLDDPGVVFSEKYTVEDRRAKRFRSELSVDLGVGTSVQQEVSLEIGVARSTDNGIVLPLVWRPTGRQRLVPKFKGELAASEARTGTELRLHGTYNVPLGALGKFGDRIVGRRVARRSLGALAERLAWRLESEVERRLDSVNNREHGALHDHQHSEIYVG